MAKIVKLGIDKKPKDLTKKEIENIEVKNLEVIKPKKLENTLIGFDRVAKDMRKKIEKLARQKGISTFNLIGIPTKGGIPKFSGGIVGDVQVIGEGLYNMANQRNDIKELLYIIVRGLKDAELLKETSISKLHGAGKISARLFNTLNNELIHDLRDLTKYTQGEVLKIRNMGEKSSKDLIKLLSERGLSLKNFKN